MKTLMTGWWSKVTQSTLIGKISENPNTLVGCFYAGMGIVSLIIQDWFMGVLFLFCSGVFALAAKSYRELKNTLEEQMRMHSENADGFFKAREKLDAQKKAYLDKTLELERCIDDYIRKKKELEGGQNVAGDGNNNRTSSPRA